MTKEELVREIYKVQSQIRELKGEGQLDLSDRRVAGIMDGEAYHSKKYELEERLESIRKEYEGLVAKTESDARVAAYYATPEGRALKSELESGIEAKIEEWKALEAGSRDALETLIREPLGDHWGVVRMNRGYACIGVIDREKSTPEQRTFYFGQEIELRYESRGWLSGSAERFESSCGSTGSFDIEGGQTVGQRAMFYAGIGRLYSNPELVQAVKELLRRSESETQRISGELDALRKRLANPTEGLRTHRLDLYPTAEKRE